VLISHRKQFIYTKTVKTAGTSVESYFEKYCMPEGAWEYSRAREEYVSEQGIIGYRGTDPRGRQWFNHMSAAVIREKVGIETWRGYFKFCVMRNPFDKLVSQFYFLRKQGNIPSQADAGPVESFRQWISRGVTAVDRDKYMIDDSLCMDYFIRFEDLEDGVRYVCDRVNASFEPKSIPHLKAKARDRSIPLREFYDGETARLVRKAYAFEIDQFGYDLPE